LQQVKGGFFNLNRKGLNPHQKTLRDYINWLILFGYWSKGN
jgi:hypothetical protein